jgi:hypothetical protein
MSLELTCDGCVSVVDFETVEVKLVCEYENITFVSLVWFYKYDICLFFFHPHLPPQREQEYAEARLRILGEARSPEEQLQIATNDR